MDDCDKIERKALLKQLLVLELKPNYNVLINYLNAYRRKCR